VGTEIVGDQALGVGDLEVLSVPGHTLGSIALFSPADRLLVTGDSIAESGGIVMLGPFNVDPEQAWASVQRLASLDVDIACFGHGDPVLGDAATVLRGAVNPWVG
jgi:glyoxylase-like metal-dependent hydrolase (beta-lactamase superfamily II)